MGGGGEAGRGTGETHYICFGESKIKFRIGSFKFCHLVLAPPSGKCELAGMDSFLK